MYNPYTFDYLKHPDKIGETRAADSIRLMICVFEDLFIKQGIENLVRDSKVVTDINNYSFYITFLITLNTSLDQTFKVDPLHNTCDQVLCIYLFSISPLVNNKWFYIILKIIISYRETYNTFYGAKYELGPDIEFSAMTTAEDFPEVANNFMQNFSNLEERVQSSMGFSKQDAVEIICNICSWMFNNNFTCSKLTFLV